MNTVVRDLDRLLFENAELRARLDEAEDTLAAIRNGDVDALVVGNDIYTLDSANAATNKLRKDVLAQMEDAVLAFDNDDHLIFMNPAAERQYGATSSETLGRSRFEVYREEWPDPAVQAASQRDLKTNGAYRAHSIHVRLDGRALHVESTVSRLRNAEGEDLGYLCVIRDISERIQAEEQLRRIDAALRDADRRKDEFLATLAHELRNPLAPMRNALQIMQLTQDAVMHENARGIIERQLRQMVHLVEDLLDVSRISQGKIELRRQRIDVASVVQIAIETSRPVIDAGRHELSLILPPPRTLMVDADVTRLSQVLSNLLNNAAKYTPAGGRIEVAARREDKHALISVQDSGVGIPKEMLPRVFDLFAQVDRSLERSQGGLGIGLALVKRLMEMHGGSVHAHSEGQGRGCRFVVCIPLA